jgi:CheY-like chemotaxis protein
MALTAGAMRGDKERALELGFTGYVTKPISLTALRNEVARLLK